MSAAGRFLRQTKEGYYFWCPGCKHAHHLPIGEGAGPRWTFDGNLEKPTFNPSIRVFTHATPAEDDWPAMPEQTLCHLFIKAGQIDYLTDSSSHALRGLVDMVPIDTLTDYSFGGEL